MGMNSLILDDSTGIMLVKVPRNIIISSTPKVGDLVDFMGAVKWDVKKKENWLQSNG